MTKSWKKSSFEDHQTTKVTMKKLLYNECIFLTVSYYCNLRVPETVRTNIWNPKLNLMMGTVSASININPSGLRLSR